MQSPTTNTPENGNRVRQGVRLWARKQAMGMILLIVILFASAGRLDWLQGWIFVFMMAGFILGNAFLLIRKSPALLAERSRLPEGAKRWDVWLASAAVIWMPITVLEDGTLKAELDGYREFAARVGYRLIPGLWSRDVFHTMPAPAAARQT